MKHLYLLLFLSLFPSIYSQNATLPKMKWAISRHEGVNTTRKDQSEYQTQALIMFKEIAMNNSTIIYNKNGKPIFELEWLEMFDDAVPAKAYNNTLKFCEDKDVKFCFYTPLGDVATPCLLYIDNNKKCDGKIAMGANGMTKDWYLERKRVFSIPPITDERFNPILSFLKVIQKDTRKKVKVALIYNDSKHVFYPVVCRGLLDPKLQKNYDYEVVLNLNITFTNNITNPNFTTADEIVAGLALINNTQVDAVLACFLEVSGIYFLQHIKEKQYDFDLLGVTTSSPSYLQAGDNTFTDYVLWVDDYASQVERGKDEFFGNATNFDKIFKKRFNKDISAHPSVYRNFYAYTTVLKAVQNAQSDNYEDLMLAMSRTDYETIVGRLTYDSFHRTSIKPTTVQTLFNGSEIVTTVVGPPTLANALPILPVPKYRERVYNPNFTSEEIAFLAIALVFIAISVVAGLAILFKRQHPIIKSAAPLFMMGIIIGSICIYIGSIFFRVHQLSNITCHVQVWFLALGFILMFGCLFAKSFRVWRLWNANLAKPTQVITDSQLGIIVGVLTSVQVVLLLIYSIAGDVEKSVFVKDPYRPIHNVEYCTNNTTGLVVLVLLVLYGFLLMSFGIFLAWTTRKVPFLAFNESKIILFSMYNVAIFTLLALIVVLNAREMNEQTEFVLHSICILLSSFVTVSISVGNKFYLILHGKTNKSKTQSVTQNNPNKSRSSIIEDDIPKGEYEAIAQENEALKAKINNLQSKVGEFEE